MKPPVNNKIDDKMSSNRVDILLMWVSLLEYPHALRKAAKAEIQNRTRPATLRAGNSSVGAMSRRSTLASALDSSLRTGVE